MADELFVILIIVVIGWMMYMYTFKTEAMMKIQDQHHNHMGKVAKGAGKAGLFIFKLFKR